MAETRTGPADPVRPRAERLAPQERRRQLMDVTRELVAENGMDTLTVEAVARAAGVTRPVIYDLFGELQGLLLALIEREESTIVADLLTIVGDGDPPPGTDPEIFLVAAMLAFLEAVRRRPATWRLALTPPQGVSLDVRQRFRRTRDLISDRVRNLLDWGVAERGGPSGLDHALFARLIVAIGEDAARLTLVHPRTYPPRRLGGYAQTMLALLPPDAEPRLGEPPRGYLSLTERRAPGPSGASTSTPGAPMRRAERRSQLLDLALIVIAEEGWEALSMEAVARLAGVNRVVVYRSFTSLNGLLLALLAREDRRTRKLLDALLPADAGEALESYPSMPELLAGTLARFLDGVLANPLTYRVVLQRPENAPVILRKLVGRRRTALARQLEPLVALGLGAVAAPTGEIDVDVLSRMLLSAGEELGRLVLDEPEFPAPRVLAACWELLDRVPLG